MVIEIHCSKLEDAMLNLPLTISTLKEEAAPKPVEGTDTEAPLGQETAVQRRKRNYEQVTPFKYFCELCSFKTKRNSHYLKHMKIHEKVSLAACPDNQRSRQSAIRGQTAVFKSDKQTRWYCKFLPIKVQI